MRRLCKRLDTFSVFQFCTSIIIHQKMKEKKKERKRVTIKRDGFWGHFLVYDGCAREWVSNMFWLQARFPFYACYHFSKSCLIGINNTRIQRNLNHTSSRKDTLPMVEAVSQGFYNLSLPDSLPPIRGRRSPSTTAPPRQTCISHDLFNAQLVIGYGAYKVKKPLIPSSKLYQVDHVLLFRKMKKKERKKTHQRLILFNHLTTWHFGSKLDDDELIARKYKNCLSFFHTQT